MTLLFEELTPNVLMRRAVVLRNRPSSCHAYVLDQSILVEPACNLDEERDEWIAWGRENKIGSVVLTHYHYDHVDFVRDIADGIGVPLCGPICPPPKLRIDQTLRSGYYLEAFRVIEAPGHCPDHIVLWDGDEKTLVLGDAIKPGNPGDSKPHELLATIKRLAKLHPELAVRAHGEPFEYGSFAESMWLRLSEPPESYAP